MNEIDCNNARELMAKYVASVTQRNITIYGKTVNKKTNHEKKYQTSCQSLSFI